MNFDQSEFEVRCGCGKQGVLLLAPISDVVIVVDVLSFSTCIDVATSRGAIVFPYQWRDESAHRFARSVGAELADQRGTSQHSLSLLTVIQGTRLVLPSPNGSTLSLAIATTPTITGCLRNCRAVAEAAARYGRRIAVIPVGERWSDGSLRPAFENFVGAGATIDCLKGGRSPEAQLAVAAYRSVDRSLRRLGQHCGSARELIDRGFERDVALALELNVSDCVPTLMDGAYVNLAGRLSTERDS